VHAHDFVGTCRWFVALNPMEVFIDQLLSFELPVPFCDMTLKYGVKC